MSSSRWRALSAIVARAHPCSFEGPAARQLFQVGWEGCRGSKHHEHGSGDLLHVLARELGQLAKRGVEGALGGRGRRLNDGNGCFSGGTLLLQALADVVDELETHVEDRGLLGSIPCDLRPVHVRHLLGLSLANDEANLVHAEASVCQRHLARGGCPQGRGDTGHHLWNDAMPDEELDLLRASTEDERVAALQAHDAAPPLAVQQHEIVDLGLLQASVLRISATLAHIDEFGRLRHEVEDLLGDEVVVQHDLGVGQPPRRAQGEELRVAGAGAHEGD
eukprot:CAMPEP_0204004478 /NCGR_PEP_ID=MMETSP0360-20130528/18397_1 /ASSEMBLY_ACC=CAM_ASM_000342 /TAXON_ID=268821 /ORGANISM="Scrippsiella Hangoei, Strain SHTV-5" /LENGTH=276 /DNA_ID=CAMNT_0050946341 /DNA_START=28 /DNA_END=855 /DNA_ORIENTATION=-